MKKMFSLLTIVLLLITGCILNNDKKNNDSNNTGNSGVETFFPFKIGATWTYSSHSVIDTYINDDTYTETITATTPKTGKTYWVMVRAHQGYADTSMFRIENNIVYTFFENFQVAKAAKLSEIHKVSRIYSDLEVPFFKFGLAQGESYTIYNYSANAQSIQLTGKYIGTESVTVSAGTFKNCSKFEITITYQSTQNNTSNSDITTNTMWFAPNVGLVKEVDVSSFTTAGVTHQGMIDTISLTSYTIP